jgi:hypothetical protein
MMFNGQYLQRVDPRSGEILDRPQGIVGCYKYFSKNSGYDARWDVGIVHFVNGQFRWTNHVGVSWEMIPDFQNLRFRTNKTNPYFPVSFLLETTFAPISGETATCKQFIRHQIGFPLERYAATNTPEPQFLAVVVDFKEKYALTSKEELARFELEKVENFWDKNSYGKSKLKFQVFDSIIQLGESSNSFENNMEDKIFPILIDKLSKELDLKNYAGFLFASPSSGPRLQAGYLGAMTVEGTVKPIVWMGGWNPKVENWVPAWKVVAHEVGHAYGLPDLYMNDGSNSAGKTLGPFDIMDGVTGISNSVTFLQRWMLGWLSDNLVSCLLPTEAPITLNLSPVIEDSSLYKGIIVPLSEYESILIEARVKSEFDNLADDQEGILVYRSDTRIKGGEGPLTIIPSKNNWTNNSAVLDDVERFKYGTLRLRERVNYKDVFVEYTKREGRSFTVTITRGEKHFLVKDADEELKAKQEADAKAAAELKAKQEAEAKAAAELKAKQEAEAKAAAELKAKQEAEAKAAAELKAKQEAEAKAAAELKAKQEADAKAAAELKAKQEADAKAAAELKAKQEADAKAAASPKKTTITCKKGKLTKKVTAVKPTCPKGYKKK